VNLWQHQQGGGGWPTNTSLACLVDLCQKTTQTCGGKSDYKYSQQLECDAQNATDMRVKSSRFSHDATCSVVLFHPDCLSH
jgi:hypothetical protein